MGASFLTASAALADGVAYVDCASHPEDTQVFAKPRRTPDAVAAIPCGERFTILLNGFIFSRVQTRDGQVGYVYSSIISIDRSGAAVAKPNATSLSPVASAPVPAKAVSPTPTPASPTGQPAPVQQAAVQTSQASSSSSNPPSSTNGVASSLQTAATAAIVDPNVPTPAAVQPPAAPVARAQAPAASASFPEATVPVAQPEPTPAAPETAATSQPEPAAAEPTPALKPVSVKESWERPNAGGKRFMPLIELFGGYSFARFDSGAGSFTNFNGVLGSFGWNIKPWLQLVADSSYNVVTVAGTKNILYGNHYGPRVFWRGRGRWSATPFVEGLVGGSRADTSISGVSGYSTSTNSISYKVGGGLDIKPSRHFEIRVIDVDYYLTSFGPNVHQNNYWASAGIVIRLFGGSE
jgi:hypothetical protein